MPANTPAISAAEIYAALPPLPTEITLSTGQQIAITPLKLGEIPAMAAAIAPLQNLIKTMAEGRTPNLMAIIATQGESILKALSIATRQPIDALADLDLADSITLAEAVLACNADFFSQRVLPRATQAASHINTLAANWRKPLPTS